MWPLCPSTVAIPQPIVLSDKPCSWNVWHFTDLPSQKKAERKREGRKKIKKCAPSPHLFRRLPALSFSFWAELDQLWPGASGSSIPTAIFFYNQGSLGSLYWGYPVPRYIKKRRLRDINGKCGIVTAVKPLLCPPFFLCLARGAEGLGIKVLLKSWDRDKTRER